MAKKSNTDPATVPGPSQPPIVAVVGHIDHGKSTLLDYIRKSNVAEGEAGGITQHLSAYQATHKNAAGEHVITFLDTPGHEAFAAMRSRGLRVADVAILVVAADDGAKPQTKEALSLIAEAKIPYIVAFTKIDKPGANIEKAKMSMLEAQVFLEGLGGDVPWVGVSGKSGEGVPELLDLILLQAELEGLTSDALAPGSGLVIEAHVDQRRGNTATIIVQDGTINSGEFVVSGEALAPVRIMENFLGKPIKEAPPGSPVRIVGWSVLPAVGASVKTVETKKEAEIDVAEARLQRPVQHGLVEAKTTRGPVGSGVAGAPEEPVEMAVFPLIIKTDVAGTGEAVMHELAKLPTHDNLEVRFVNRAVGTINEADVKTLAGGSAPGVIVGFNVKVEREAKDLAERQGVTIETFDIIYKLAEWLGARIEERRPRTKVEMVVGAAKVLKFFSATKGRVILGGRVEEGVLKDGAEVKILRRDIEIGRGKITSLQSSKKDVKEVEIGSEFGAQVKTEALPAAGDRIEAYLVEQK
ncbi:MAG: translation initiation factor IF-2 [Patescibacteria group bacterium]